MAAIRALRALAAGIAPATALLLAIAAAAPDALAAPGGCNGKSRRAATCPGNNQPPTISGTPIAQATVGQAYAFVPGASDPDGKSLSFSIVNRPPWAAFSASTGRLSGTPDSSAEGEHADIVIAVSDGVLSAALPPFSIVVSPGNRAPSIVGTPVPWAREGQAYEFRPSAADADGDALQFTIVNRPAWATFDAATGVLRGTPGAGTVGSYSDITIRVSDGELVTALPAFSIEVEQVSMGRATLSWVPPTQRDDGSPLVGLAGYRIYYGIAPGTYPNQVKITNPGITTVVIENLPPGTYYFVATSYDSAGVESGYSAIVAKTIS